MCANGLAGSPIKAYPRLGDDHFVVGIGGTDMRQTKRSAKGRRVKEAVPVLGAVGMSLSFAGGASAATAPAMAPDVASKDVVTNHEFALTEEEVSDVSLGTFFVFDKEGRGTARAGQQYARGCGCG